MENTQYLKYKDRFKKMGIYNIASSICALIFIVLLIFIKSFTVKVEGYTILQFSIYDEFVRSIKSMTSGENSILAYLEIYSVFAFIMLLSVAIASIVELVKNILNITNLERYALTQYDNIKRRQEDNSRRRKRGNFSVLSMLYTGIFLEIIGIAYSKFIAGLFSGDEEMNYLSYFAEVNGISFNIVFCLLVGVAFSVLYFIMRKIFRDVKFEILKEEYDAN